MKLSFALGTLEMPIALIPLPSSSVKVNISKLMTFFRSLRVLGSCSKLPYGPAVAPQRRTFGCLRTPTSHPEVLSENLSLNAKVSNI